MPDNIQQGRYRELIQAGLPIPGLPLPDKEFAELTQSIAETPLTEEQKAALLQRQTEDVKARWQARATPSSDGRGTLFVYDVYLDLPLPSNMMANDVDSDKTQNNT